MVAPVVAAAGIAAGGSLLGGLMGSSSAKKAAREQAKAAQAAIAEQQRQFDLTRSDAKPWMQAGSGAVYSLADLLGIKTGVAPTAPTTAQFTTTQPGYWTAAPMSGNGRGMSPSTGPGTFTPGKTLFNQQGYDAAMAEYAKAKAAYDAQSPSGALLKPFTGESLASDPGYQFRLDQGYKTVDRNLRRGGSTLGGNTLRSIMEYGQNYGANEFNNAFTRDLQTKQNTFNMLSGLSGTGQMATTATAQLGQNATNNISNLMTDVGNARGAGAMGQANAWANALAGVGNTAMDYMSYRTPGASYGPATPQQMKDMMGDWY